jgi:ATP-dependent Lon protease
MGTNNKNPIETKPQDQVLLEESRKLLPATEILPIQLPLIQVNQAIVFPGMIVPMILSQDRHKNAIQYILEKKQGSPAAPFIGVGILRDTADTVKTLKDILPYGVAGRIVKRMNLPDGSLSILVNFLKRFEIQKIHQTDPLLIAGVQYLDDVYFGDTETEALARTVVNQFKQISQDNPLITEEMRLAMVNVDGPGKLSDLLASILIRDNKNYSDFLATLDVKKRLEKLLVLLKKEIDVHNFQAKIQGEINQNVGKAQRDFFLNEQLKLIQKELGHTNDDRTNAKNKFTERIAKLKLSEEASKRVKDELEKLDMLNENSPEFGVTYNYLDWISSLPWGIQVEENRDLRKARQILSADHFGLEEVKERILEFIAVRKLKNNSKGSIICLVGPPGVGKTSLGKSIANALNRPFYRFSVGGMRDEAEIKGHRRTYIGAMPGKVVLGLKKAAAMNPVFMIDEIDKLGNDFRGDPASALLEVLDPEQNVEFLDNYLDLSFDASNVLFIATANQLDTIPGPLLDRMEVIRLPGYIMEEKLAIVKKYIIPKQLEKNGLTKKDIFFPDTTLKALINGYAREAGVRSLEKWIEQICRKRALKVASLDSPTKKKGGINKTITKALLSELIGSPYFSENEAKTLKPGLAVGLAWTAMGGDTLVIESVGIKSSDRGLKLTGQMGNVMTESAALAWTYVRKILSEDITHRKFITTHGVHLHIPAGGVPKDGPSAGITLATSLYSLITGKVVKRGLAMTGELTLSGLVLPVGGIKEKIIAANRNGYRKILIPYENKRDLKEIPKSVKKGLKIHLVKTMKEVLKHAF